MPSLADESREVIRAAFAQPRPVTPDAPASSVRVVLLADLLADPDAFALPAPLALPVSWPGRLTLLAGREKSGKSVLASHMAAEASRAGHEVAIVALDEPIADTARRLAGMGADAQRVRLLDGFDAVVLTSLQPALVVLDHIGKLAALDPDFRPGSAGDELLYNRLLAPLLTLARRQNAAVVLLSQASKSTNTYLNSVALGAAADVIATVEVNGETRTLRTVGRFPAGSWRLDLDADGRLVPVRTDVADAPAPEVVRVHHRPVPEADQRALLALLRDCEPEGVRYNAWQREVREELGWPASRFKRTRTAIYPVYASHTSGIYHITSSGRRFLDREEDPDEP